MISTFVYIGKELEEPSLRVLEYAYVILLLADDSEKTLVLCTESPIC